jgi:glycosyltransferase involved in cell wall biosynthesis
MREITILTFNYGNAGGAANGPGMCLVNFVRALDTFGIRVNVFSHLPSSFKEAKDIKSLKELYRAIDRSDIFHHWSGMSLNFGTGRAELKSVYDYARATGCKIIIGPNLLDTVVFHREQRYLEEVGSQYDTLLTVNQHLKYRLSRKHEIPLDKIEILMIGPDLDLWKPIPEDNGRILWKGNARHKAKGIGFAKKLVAALPEYQIDFMGHLKPYHYYEHIEEAKKYHLYVSTSLSETMGLALAEQWAAGIPSVTHPKIHLHGKNYETGIIVDRSIDEYVKAIREIMKDASLHSHLSGGSRKYMEKNFSKEKIVANYRNICRG